MIAGVDEEGALPLYLSLSLSISFLYRLTLSIEDFLLHFFSSLFPFYISSFFLLLSRYGVIDVYKFGSWSLPTLFNLFPFLDVSISMSFT
jgi:hypothetical protein